MDNYTQLGLRGFPRQLARAAKKAAAQREMTLTQFIAEAVQSALLRESPAMARPPTVPQDLADDVAWYNEHRSDLLADPRLRRGTNLAIVGAKMVDHDADLDALMKRLRARFGERSVFVPKLAPPAGTPARFRSPRKVS
ncbi:MAG: hypothetical protein JO060_10335 [Candidatus Eremiobacteraeota bacterium]|nr:hypothetical protein [Candidatus Eremiobacteraeota bacterium]MBV9648401.1 hypothetical protein [Candidatus Eremiobacteraeota bacterium]